MQPDRHWSRLQASGVKPSQPAFERGVAFLLRTQRPDGSWLVHAVEPVPTLQRERLPVRQGSVDLGRGKTSWAAMALCSPIAVRCLSRSLK